MSKCAQTAKAAMPVRTATSANEMRATSLKKPVCTKTLCETICARLPRSSMMMIGVVAGGMTAAGPSRTAKILPAARTRTPQTATAGMAQRPAASQVARTMAGPSRSASALGLPRHQAVAGGAVELVGDAIDLERGIENDGRRAEPKGPRHQKIRKVVDIGFA